MKDLGFLQSQTNLISSTPKYIGIAGPLFGIFVDTFPYRQWYLMVGAVSKIVLSYFMITQVGGEPNMKKWILFKCLDAVALGLFYSSFYSFFGIYLPKEIKGIGMGLNQSILALTPFLLPIMTEKWELKMKLKFYLGMGVVSLV